jgi:hypothetical protein
MAAADASTSFPAAGDCPVSGYGGDEVLAAGWVEATVSAQQRTKQQLVQTHHDDQQSGHSGGCVLVIIRVTSGGAHTVVLQ